MKTKATIFMGIIAIIFFCSYGPGYTLIDKATWLIGRWENKTIKDNLYETWQKVSANELSGKSYYLKGGDTILYETVQLLERENKLFYIVTAKNQNDELPVSFGSVTVTNDLLIFENKAHDFPQVIKYHRVNKDSLTAEISGTSKGQERKQMFPMRRIQ